LTINQEHLWDEIHLLISRKESITNLELEIHE